MVHNEDSLKRLRVEEDSQWRKPETDQDAGNCINAQGLTSPKSTNAGREDYIYGMMTPEPRIKASGAHSDSILRSQADRFNRYKANESVRKPTPFEFYQVQNERSPESNIPTEEKRHFQVNNITNNYILDDKSAHHTNLAVFLETQLSSSGQASMQRCSCCDESRRDLSGAMKGPLPPSSPLSFFHMMGGYH